MQVGREEEDEDEDCDGFENTITLPLKILEIC